MARLLYPDLYYDTLFDIPLVQLKKRGIKGIIVDLDNTITHWNSREITEEVCAWFEQVEKLGLKACILSNNGEKRVLEVAEKLNLPYIHKAQKPRRFAFYLAVERMGLKKEETAMIGDQIFTDVLGGNRAGLITILVTPLGKKEFVGTKISRLLETFILRRLFKNQ